MVKDYAWELKLFLTADQKLPVTLSAWNREKIKSHKFLNFSTYNHERVFPLTINFSHTNFEVRKYWGLLFTWMWRHLPTYRRNLLLLSSGKKEWATCGKKKHSEGETEQTFRRFWGTSYTSLRGRQILTPLPWKIRQTAFYRNMIHAIHFFSPNLNSLKMVVYSRNV